MNDSLTLINNYYAAFNSKNYEEMLNTMSDNVVHDISQSSSQCGKVAFREFLKDMDSYYDEKLDDILVMIHLDGKRAAAEFFCNGTYKNTAEGLPLAKGQQYRIRVGCFFEIDNHKITRVSNHYNMSEWLQQIK